MRRTAAMLAWGALSSPVAAWLKFPFVKSADSESWTPPRETGVVDAQVDANQVELGWSPRPTDGPKLFGRMLVERMDEYTLGPKTCGFVSSNANSFTCITDGATCSYSSDWIGCCEPNKDCNIVKTTCIDYDASASGECNLPSDFHTLCCGTSALGACYTWLLSTTGSGSESDGVVTLLDCSARSGTGTLLDYDPLWSRTHSFNTDDTSTTESSTTSSSSTDPGSSTETDTAPSQTTSDDGGDNDDGGSSTPVGAIAGGVVGGVAALGLVGLAAFLFLRRKKKAPKSADGSPPMVTAAAVPPPGGPPAMSQGAPSHAPTSPGGAAYPSGVPSSFQGFQQQQPYDPNMAAYNNQGQYPQQPGYGAYSPQPGFQQQAPPPGFQPGAYQQQGQYPPSQYGYTASSTSPPPHHTPSPGGLTGTSPGPREGESTFATPTPVSPAGHHSTGPAQELPAINPVGNESNRAELG